jgi:hypothetical protein
MAFIIPDTNFSDEPLNGTVNDESGNGNNGTISGETNFASGLVGQAFEFDGETRIVVNDSPSLNPTNAITLSAWFNANNWNGNPRILCNGQSIDLNDEFGSLGFSLNVGAFYDASISTVLPSTGVWHHVAATYDGALETLYIDGTNMVSQVTNGPITYPGPSLFNIGAKVTQPTDCCPTSYFDGMIEMYVFIIDLCRP